MKIGYVPFLVIEATRRCQFQCDHCLRGYAQNKDMDMRHVEALLDQVEHIGFITFTGGEPSLNTDCINQTLELCKKKNIAVESFYIATNGHNIREDFVVACLKWYAYCYEKDMCRIVVSNDQFHAGEGQYNTELLDGLSFFDRKHAQEAYYYEPIAEGLAKENGLGDHPNRENEEEIEMWDNGIQEGTLYLNCNGDIIKGCDWSYESQEEQKLCTVKELTNFLGLPTE